MSEISNTIIKAALVTAIDTIWSVTGSITAVIFFFAKLTEAYINGWSCLPTEPVEVPYFLEDKKSLLYAPEGLLGNILALVGCFAVFFMAVIMSQLSWTMFKFVVDVSRSGRRPSSGLTHYAEFMIVRFLFVVCIMANLYLHRMHSIPMYTISILYILRCVHINPLVYLTYELIGSVFAYFYISAVAKYFKVLPQIENAIKEEDLDDGV